MPDFGLGFLNRPVLSFLLMVLVTTSAWSQPARSAESLSNSSAGNNGVWRTEGYGTLLEISSQRGRLYETTEISCLPGEEFRVLRAAAPDGEVSYPLVTEATLELDADDGYWTLLSGDSDDEKWLQIENTTAMRRLERADSLPENCTLRRSDPDPVTNFNIFWQSFADHYPLFAEKGIDWNGAGQRERRNVTPATQPEALFEILKRMIEPLGDTHTYLRASNLNLSFRGHRQDLPQPPSEQLRRAVAIIDEGYLTAIPHEHCNRRIAHGSAEGGVTYLRLTSFDEYGGNFRQGLDCIDAAMDELLSGQRANRGLIIDLRLNRGGYDAYGLAFARRLTDTGYLAYVYEARVDPTNPQRFAPGQPIFVKPASGLRHTGQVIVLTGPGTEGTAEVFALTLEGRLNGATRVGQATQGALSDTLVRLLPNGWRFQLPNSRYLDSTGSSLSGTGLLPDIEVPVFAAGDLAAGRDPALEQALQILDDSAGR